MADGAIEEGNLVSPSSGSAVEPDGDSLYNSVDQILDRFQLSDSSRPGTPGQELPDSPIERQEEQQQTQSPVPQQSQDTHGQPTPAQRFVAQVQAQQEKQNARLKERQLQERNDREATLKGIVSGQRSPIDTSSTAPDPTHSRGYDSTGNVVQTIVPTTEPQAQPQNTEQQIQTPTPEQQVQTPTQAPNQELTQRPTSVPEAIVIEEMQAQSQTSPEPPTSTATRPTAGPAAGTIASRRGGEPPRIDTQTAALQQGPVPNPPPTREPEEPPPTLRDERPPSPHEDDWVVATRPLEGELPPPLPPRPPRPPNPPQNPLQQALADAIARAGYRQAQQAQLEQERQGAIERERQRLAGLEHQRINLNVSGLNDGREATRWLRDHLEQLDAAERARQEAARAQAQGQQPQPVAAHEADREARMKGRISALQKKSRSGNRMGHLDLYLERLGRIDRDKQSKSPEFKELQRTIYRMPPEMAGRFLAESFTKAEKDANKQVQDGRGGGRYGDIDSDVFRQLRNTAKARAPMVAGSWVSQRAYRDRGGSDGWDKFGKIGVKETTVKVDYTSNNSTYNSSNPANVDAFSALNSTTSGGTLTTGFAEDAKALYENSTYLNVPKLQVNKEKDYKVGKSSVKGHTRLFESTDRPYVGTASSIDPTKIAPANQSFMRGKQVQHNWIHFNYTPKFESKSKALSAEGTAEGSVDGFVGSKGDLHVGFSVGQYPAVQIQGAAFLGGRVTGEGKLKLKLRGHDIVELKGKAFASAGLEASGSMSFGRAYDSIEGQSRVTGAEFGGMAFAGARAGYEAGGELAGIGGKVKGEVWHGIGLVHKWYAHKDAQGTIQLGGEYGAALGVGGSFGWGVSVNPAKFLKAIREDLPDKAMALAGAAAHKGAEAVAYVARAARLPQAGRKIAEIGRAAAATTPGQAVVAVGAGAGHLAAEAGRKVADVGIKAGRAYNRGTDGFVNRVSQFNPDLRNRIRNGFAQQRQRPVQQVHNVDGHAMA